MKEVIAIIDLSGRRTVTVTDIIFILNRVGLTLPFEVADANRVFSKEDLSTDSTQHSSMAAKRLDRQRAPPLPPRILSLNVFMVVRAHERIARDLLSQSTCVYLTGNPSIMTM